MTILEIFGSLFPRKESQQVNVTILTRNVYILATNNQSPNIEPTAFAAPRVFHGMHVQVPKTMSAPLGVNLL